MASRTRSVNLNESLLNPNLTIQRLTLRGRAPNSRATALTLPACLVRLTSKASRRAAHELEELPARASLALALEIERGRQPPRASSSLSISTTWSRDAAKTASMTCSVKAQASREATFSQPLGITPKYQ